MSRHLEKHIRAETGSFTIAGEPISRTIRTGCEGGHRICVSRRSKSNQIDLQRASPIERLHADALSYDSASMMIDRGHREFRSALCG